MTDTFTLCFHKDTTPEEHESAIRAVSYHRNKAVSRLRQYEREHPDFDALDFDQRHAQVVSTLDKFKDLLETISYVAINAKAYKGRRYFHFSMSYPDYEEVVQTESAEILDSYMHNAGGYVSRRIFRSLSKAKFDDYLTPIESEENTRLIGSVEILFHGRKHPTRMCFWVCPISQQEMEGAFSEVFKTVPEAADIFDEPMVRKFIKDPDSNPEALAHVMEALCVMDPNMASTLQNMIDPSPQTRQRECIQCHVAGNKLFQCSRCKGVLYCSRACQLQHWKAGGHKNVCVAKK